MSKRRQFLRTLSFSMQNLRSGVYHTTRCLVAKLIARRDLGSDRPAIVSVTIAICSDNRLQKITKKLDHFLSGKQSSFFFKLPFQFSPGTRQRGWDRWRRCSPSQSWWTRCSPFRYLRKNNNNFSMNYIPIYHRCFWFLIKITENQMVLYQYHIFIWIKKVRPTIFFLLHSQFKFYKDLFTNMEKSLDFIRF